MEFCPQDCEYLDPNEEDQSVIRKLHKNHILHWCLKYKKVLKHNGHHPKIPRLPECIFSKLDLDAVTGNRKEAKNKRVFRKESVYISR